MSAEDSTPNLGGEPLSSLAGTEQSTSGPRRRTQNAAPTPEAATGPSTQPSRPADSGSGLACYPGGWCGNCRAAYAATPAGGICPTCKAARLRPATITVSYGESGESNES